MLTNKIPPQNIQLEEAVIGAILTDQGAYLEISETLVPEMFYKEGNRVIFGAITQLSKENKSIDLFSVLDYLRSNGQIAQAGGDVYITGLSMVISTAVYIADHAEAVKSSYIQRECIRIGSEMMHKGFDAEPAEEITSFAEREIFALGEVKTKKEAIPIYNILSNVSLIIEERSKRKVELTGVPSGILELDRLTLGFQPGDLIILAARPSMGKTALAVQIAKFAAASGHETAFFSLEMTERQLGERYLSHETRIGSYDLKQGNNIDWSKIEKALRDNLDRKLFIDDTAAMSIFEFRSKVRRIKKKHGLKLVICDYLQLFKGDGDKNNMSEYYGSISKMFKAVAKDEDIAVLALSQLNRLSEQRGNPFPKLSDLRNSGEIEQDADIVIFPVRYEKVGLDKEDPVLKGKARVDVAKNRNGATGDFDITVSEDCVFWDEPVIF